MLMTLRKFFSASSLAVLLAFVMLVHFSPEQAEARQSIEPDIRPASGWVSPLDFGLRHGATFNLNITNHGFSISGQYRYVIAPHTQWVTEAGFGNIKDSREQAFVTWFGQQIIPNKYNRVLNFPVMTGVRQRLLADYIEDNFRFYVSGMVGASFSFVYPYFEDIILEDGPAQVQLPGSRIYDVFQGWGDGSWQTGWSGKLALAVDFGQTFNTLTSLEFGVMGHYFPSGMQIMEPNRLLVDQEGRPSIERGTGFPAQKLFLTPTITLMFGGMW